MGQRKKTQNKRVRKAVDLRQPEEIRLAGRASIAAIAAVVLIFLFANGVQQLVKHNVVTSTESNYEDRELEILSYRWGPNENAEDAKTIRGIIHPEGIEVVTSDNTVSLIGLNHSDAVIRSVPAEKDVIGKRIKVKYFVGNPDALRWWHPPSIHNRPQLNSAGRFSTWLFTIAYFILMIFCLTYAYRSNRNYMQLTKDNHLDD